MAYANVCALNYAYIVKCEGICETYWAFILILWTAVVHLSCTLFRIPECMGVLNSKFINICRSHVYQIYLICVSDLWNRGKVRCRYNAVQHKMILHTVHQWLNQNIYPNKHSQKTPHISPWRASYGMFLWGVWKKWPRYNSTVLYSTTTDGVTEFNCGMVHFLT